MCLTWAQLELRTCAAGVRSTREEGGRDGGGESVAAAAAAATATAAALSR